MSDFPSGPGHRNVERDRRTQQTHINPKSIDLPHRQYLTFYLNEHCYALEAFQLVEVLPPPKITRVPNVPECILGVINLRGEVISVIDLKRIFGLPRGSLVANSHIVVTEQGEVRAGLLVDSIGDLVRLAWQEVTENSLSKGATQFAYFVGAAHWGEVPVTRINLEEVLRPYGL